MPECLKILVIEDELAIRRFLRASTLDSEAQWIEAGSGEEGIKLAATKNPDVVLLDLGLPDQDGLEVLRRIREWSDVPVIVISARGQERDKVQALDSGADDYLTKPFSLAELMARVRVAIRHAKRAGQEEESEYRFSGLVVDLARRYVARDGVEIRLTQIEFKLLRLLLTHAGKVITQTYLLQEVWGQAFTDSTHTLRVHMANLRAKIEAPPPAIPLIRTETGVGYRLIPPEDENCG